MSVEDLLLLSPFLYATRLAQKPNPHIETEEKGIEEMTEGWKQRHL